MNGGPNRQPSLPHIADLTQPCLEIIIQLHNFSRCFHILFSGKCQDQSMLRAPKQRHVVLALYPHQALAQIRLRYIQPGRCAGDTLLLRNRHNIL